MGNKGNAFLSFGKKFITATGGTITTVVNYKVHTFTTSGAFTVTQIGDSPNNALEYLVIAGGGGGGAYLASPASHGGCGGAGGYRTSVVGDTSGKNTSAESTITATVQAYTVTVGAGGVTRTNGSDSVFGSITSKGGGLGGGTNAAAGAGGNGGAGGGSSASATKGLGTANQGFDGGTGVSGGNGGHGGSACCANSSELSHGPGLDSTIDGLSLFRSIGGTIGGSTNGGNNTGNGGNSSSSGVANGGTGGSGVVIIRYKFQ